MVTKSSDNVIIKQLSESVEPLWVPQSVKSKIFIAVFSTESCFNLNFVTQTHMSIPGAGSFGSSSKFPYIWSKNLPKFSCIFK